MKWEVFKRNTCFPDLWCSSLRILNRTKSCCLQLRLFVSRREISFWFKGTNPWIKSYLKVFENKMSLISIEYPKAATANHNQYFRRDTRVCLFIFQKTNKQTKTDSCFVCLFVKNCKGKLKSYHSWIGQIQAKLQWRQNAMSFCFW